MVKENLLKSYNRGFTLVEILVVVGIISILAAVIAINAIDSGKISRDAKRQADLRTLQSAIELYKNKEGRYPEGCNGAGNWSGQKDGKAECGNGTQYIVGLAPKYIPVLPRDPKLGDGTGYIYTTNTDGTVYKLKAQHTVESEVVDYTHEMKACDIRVASTPVGSLVDGSKNREVIGWCGRVHPTNNLPETCKSTNSDWYASYAVWGGFDISGSDTIPGETTSYVKNTTAIICK